MAVQGARSRPNFDLQRFKDAFAKRFATRERAQVFFAPGRVNLMGAHLDYNGGPVMPTAIDRGTWVALRIRDDAHVVLASTHDHHLLETAFGELPEQRAGRWHDYPLGVVREIEQRTRDHGSLVPGFDVLFGGNLPIGAGLSSSASMCVATAYALDRALGLGLAQLEHVEIALRAERGFVGVQCGIMDPYAVAFARENALLWLDCKDRSTQHLPIDLDRHSIAVADTLVRRELARGAFNERVRQCSAAFEVLRRHESGATCLRDISAATLTKREGDLEPVLARRARHVVGEVERTFAAREALLRGDLRSFGAHMKLAHASLRNLFEVSVPELDSLVENAAAIPGVHGARLTGAGFGGCVVVLLERSVEDELRRHLVRTFSASFGHDPKVDVFQGDAGPREIATD